MKNLDLGLNASGLVEMNNNEILMYEGGSKLGDFFKGVWDGIKEGIEEAEKIL